MRQRERKDMPGLHVRIQKEGCDILLDGGKQISEEINKHRDIGKLGKKYTRLLTAAVPGT